jgi:hypothetical protein
VDDSGGRRRCGDDGRRGEAAALGGAANGCGNPGRWRAGWRGKQGRPRQPWLATCDRHRAGGRAVAVAGRAGGGDGRAGERAQGAGKRRAGGWLPATGVQARWARMRAGVRGGYCSVQREEREMSTAAFG